jgi:hypothetical protein
VLNLNEESMEITYFSGNQDEDEINPMEWLRIVKKYGINDLMTKGYLFGESCKWWMSIYHDTRLNITWEKIEKLFSNKWIRDKKREEMYKIQEELKESKENVSKLKKDNEKLRK